jgi:ribonuclease PH
VNLSSLKKSVIDVQLEILQDDGGLIPALIIAGSLALADSGVELYDLVGSVEVGMGDRGKEIVLDPCTGEIEKMEEGGKGARMVMGVMGGLGKVTMYECRGPVEGGRMAEIEAVAMKGCLAVHEAMRKSLLEKEEL